MRAATHSCRSRCISADLLDRMTELLHIEWQYQDAPTALEPRSAASAAFALQRELADELYHLAMQGDIAGLVERATDDWATIRAPAVSATSSARWRTNTTPAASAGC